MKFIKKQLNLNSVFNILKIIYSFGIIPILLFMVQDLYYKYINPQYAGYDFYDAHIMGYAIIICLFLFFYGVFNSTFLSTLFCSIILYIMLIVSQFKVILSDNPLYFTDILFVDTTDTFTDILKNTFWPTLRSVAGNFLFLFITFAVICLLAKLLNCKKYTRKVSTCIGVVGLVSLLLLFLPIRFFNDFFISNYYQVNVDKNNNPVSNKMYYYNNGFLGGMYGQYLTSILRKPDCYDKNKAISILEDADKTEHDKSWGKPNIIMVFSESFFDCSKLSDEITFSTPPTSNLHALKEKGMYTEMISPVYGGISCNTEWEMLTGGTLSYFPEGYIPYMNLYKSDKFKKAPSVIKELKNNGYYTKLLTPWSNSLFNAKNVYNYLGFDETVFGKDMTLKSYKGSYVSDKCLADNIINDFNDKIKNQNKTPMFYITLTAENHMPFNADKYKLYDIDILKSPIYKEGERMYRSYAQGVYDADLQLKQLYDYIQTIDEPTLLLFYGDHLPFIRKNGYNITDALEYFHTSDSCLNMFRKYNTQCIILDNFNAKYEQKEYLGPDLIMPYILNHMDIKLSPFYKWLYQTIDYYPASNMFVAIDENKNIKYLNNLDGKAKEYEDLRKLMNWHMFCEIK